jgi:hypothetical protein
MARKTSPTASGGDLSPTVSKHRMRLNPTFGYAFEMSLESQVERGFDWLVYAPAGKGAEVHGATLPLDEKHSITVAMAPKNDESMLDVRCGVTTAWHFDAEYPSGMPANFAPSNTPGAAAFSLDGI